MDQPPVLPDLTLLRRIGAGSYGDVWLARTLTGVYRAVKVVDRARFPDDRPFQRELEGISRFQRSVGGQPRQLALMHVGRLEPQGILYYVMELADDVAAGSDVDPERYEPLTLKALRARHPVLPAADCVVLGVELARGLVGLHAAGLIHRDVKPSNIIVVGGMPKLADIGLVSSREASVTSLGTPGYSPPEGSGSQSADLFGLGRMLYELVTGLNTGEFPRLPPDFDKRTDAGALLELNEVVLRACEPDPKDRYPSAQAMLDDLLLIQAGKSVKELNETRRRLKVFGRFALLAGAAAALIIAVLGVRNYFAVRALAVQETAARQQAETDERLARYTADLNRAQLSLLREDLGIARVSLRRQIPKSGEPDLRGPEWHAMWGDAAGNVSRVLASPSAASVQDISVSRDGGMLAAREGGTSSGDLVLWDISTGTRRVLGGEVRSLGGFAVDGSRLIAGGESQNVRLFDTATGAAQPDQSTDGRLLSGIGDGRRVLLYHAQPFGYRVELWDAIAGQSLATIESEPRPDNWRPQAFAVSSDGRLLATAANVTRGMAREREIIMWDVPGNQLLWRVPDQALAQTMAFSLDHRWLAVGGARAPVRLYDVGSGVLVATMPGHQRSIVSVAFSPDGQQLASAGGDSTVRLWRVPSGELIAVLRGHESEISRVIWAPDGQTLYSASLDGTVRQWTLPVPVPPTVIPGLWSQIEGDFMFVPGANQIAVTDQTGAVSLYDDTTLTFVRRLDGVFQPLALTDNGTAVVALASNREFVRYDITSGQVVSLGLRAAGEERLLALSASPDGTRAALASFNRQITIFDVRAGTTVTTAEPHGQQVTETTFSPDGRWLASVDGDGTLMVWNAADGSLRHRYPLGGFAILAVKFSPLGDRILIGNDKGQILSVVEASGVIEAAFTGHSGSVNSLTWSPDGSRLVSAGDDGFLDFWLAGDYRLLATIPVVTPSVATTDQGVFIARFSPDGRKLGTFTEDGRLRIWIVE